MDTVHPVLLFVSAKISSSYQDFCWIILFGIPNCASSTNTTCHCRLLDLEQNYWLWVIRCTLREFPNKQWSSPKEPIPTTAWAGCILGWGFGTFRCHRPSWWQCLYVHRQIQVFGSRPCLLPEIIPNSQKGPKVKMKKLGWCLSHVPPKFDWEYFEL